MSIHIKVGGVWKNLTGSDVPSIKVGGTWKTPNEVHIKVGGVWKKVWEDIQAQAYAPSYYELNIDPTDSYAGVRYHSDGTVDGTSATTLNWAYSVGTWLLGGNNSDVDVKFDVTSGDTPSGDSTGTWLNLATTRSWYHAVTGLGFKNTSYTITLRNATTLATLSTASGVLEASVEI